MKSFLLLALGAITALADTTIKDLSELKVPPLPFPALTAPAVAPLTLEQIQQQADALALTLGTFPPRLKKPGDRQEVYEAWTQVLTAAHRVQIEQGDTEPVVRVLAELYREGHNLDVSECAQRAAATLKAGLAQYPDSIPLNFEAAHFYLGLGQGGQAENALLHLRVLLKTTEAIEVERPLLFAYIYQGKRAEGMKQVDHCLALQPGDPFYVQTKESLSKGGYRRIRVPVGSPNEVTLKGDPTIHLALDRVYQTMEIKPKEGAPKKDLRAYLFAPEDGQSSASLFIGNDGHLKTEAVIAEMFEGAKVTKVKGRFNESEVELWRYRDSHHLYSTFWVTATDSAGVSKRVQIDLVANTPERLESLEKAFSLIDFL